MGFTHLIVLQLFAQLIIIIFRLISVDQAITYVLLIEDDHLTHYLYFF